MITTVSDRKNMDKIKTSYEEVISFDGKTVAETDFIQATQSQSMFASKKLVIVEGVPKFKIQDCLVDVVIFEDKKGFPQSLSKFLNNMTVPNFRNALKDNDVQFVFIMMCRQRGVDKNKLLELDYQNKQGLLPVNFTDAIELYLLGI